MTPDPPPHVGGYDASTDTPSGLDVRDADFDFFGGERRAEFKNLDVLRLYEWFERGEINRA